MTVPAFLNSSHYYTEITDVDDVQDIIDALGTILKTTNSPAWTEPSAGTFQSPVDADGRYFQVIVSRVDVDTLQLVVKDRYAATIATRRIDINASGSPAISVYVFSGQYHLWIDCMRSTPENFRSGILDLSPQAQSAWTQKTYCHGHRTSDGSVDGGMDLMSIVEGESRPEHMVTLRNAGNGGMVFTDLAGNVVYWPVFLRGRYADVLLGRMYQIMLGPSSIAYGTEVTVPVDTGVTAKFRAAGAPTGGWDGQTTDCRFFVRAD